MLLTMIVPYYLEFDQKTIFGGDLGFGIDLGFTYKLNKQTVITGSLLDLGSYL